MADLSWFPYDAEAWERRVRDLGLSVWQEGALMRLLRAAWRSPVPCTVLDTPDELARIVGAEWKKARPVLTAHFQPLADDPSRYRCEWLYDLYLRQLERHLSYQKRGKLGGRPAKAAPKAQLEAELEAREKAELSFLSRESSAEALSCAPTEHTAKSPLPADERAPAGAALPVAGAGDQNGDYLDRPSVREELLRRGVRPSEAPPAPDVAAMLADDEARRQRDAEHFAAVRDAAWAWMRSHPVETKALGRDVRAALGFPLEAPVTGIKADTLEAQMIAAISELHQWPSADDWDGSLLLPRPDASLTLAGAPA